MNLKKILLVFSSLFLVFSGIESTPAFAIGDKTESYLNIGLSDEEIAAGTTEDNSAESGYTTNMPSATDQSTTQQKDTTIRIREPLPGQSNTIKVSAGEGSINILSTYVSGIFRFVAALSVIIAVLVLMGSGFKVMIDGSNTEARTEAKEAIGKVFMGLAFLFLAGLFLKTINPHFYLFGGGNQSGAGGADDDKKYETFTQGSQNLELNYEEGSTEEEDVGYY